MSGKRNLVPSTTIDQSSGPAAGNSSSGVGGGDLTRRRRNAGNVSLIACTECRHARQKCDGMRPDPCSRCLTRKLNCAYEPHTKTHKDDLIREIETLRGSNSSLDGQNKELMRVASHLKHQNRDLQEASDCQRKILDTIRNNGDDSEILRRLRAGESHQSIAHWLCKQQLSTGLSIVPQSQRSLVDVVKNLENHYQGEDGLNRTGIPSEAEIQWTKVSASQTLVRHLFDLYFTWVHPVHMLFSELDFKHSFQTNDQTYCSSALVNAICAMGCHLLENDGYDAIRKDVDIPTLREGFLKEARENLPPDSYHDMTAIQTFAVMYLVDVSSGKARNATGYLRSAVENLKATDRGNQSAEARELAEWGIQTLNSTCASITYQRLYAPELPKTAVFQHVRMDGDDAVWRFYRKVGVEYELPIRPSYAIMTACMQAGLFRIINESLNLYCGHRGDVSAANVIKIYKRYLDWKEDLPPRIGQIEIDDQPLPHVLYLHIQFHTALVQHFTPLLHCNYFTGSDQGELRRMIVHHARTGMEILHHSRRLYSSRYQMPLMTFCTLHLGDALVRYSPEQPPASTIVEYCLSTIKETRAGFAICGPLQELFRRTAVECGVELPDNIDDLMGPFQYAVDQILDACTRLVYTQPFDQVLRHILSTIADDWSYEWRRIVMAPGAAPRRQSSRGRYLPIDSLLNND